MSMNAKQTAATLVDQLDEDATWFDVKNTIMKVYKRETGDSIADAIAAVALCAIFVTTCIFWISTQ